MKQRDWVQQELYGRSREYQAEREDPVRLMQERVAERGTRQMRYLRGFDPDQLEDGRSAFAGVTEKLKNHHEMNRGGL